MFGGLGCCSCRVCVCRCRGCCSLSCVCVCVCVCDLLVFLPLYPRWASGRSTSATTWAPTLRVRSSRLPRARTTAPSFSRDSSTTPAPRSATPGRRPPAAPCATTTRCRSGRCYAVSVLLFPHGGRLSALIHKYLRALLSVCGRCSFGGLGWCSCRVCRCRGCCSLSVCVCV